MRENIYDLTYGHIRYTFIAHHDVYTLYKESKQASVCVCVCVFNLVKRFFSNESMEIVVFLFICLLIFSIMALYAEEKVKFNNEEQSLDVFSFSIDDNLLWN